ncbi:lysozyme inhibitor LprI family protein [Erwinia papayae]|uniref:Lysozyme inhibitor LprI family protein n=1 Tax=Erwinia papayae TaxID=206499 RepID=A0ABV3N3Q0_9GAMM
MKTRMVILFLIGTVSLNAFGNGLKILELCMNITHSGEVEGCFIELSQSMKIKYTNEFDLYLKSINTQEERPYNKKELTTLSESAKKNWDDYIENECQVESSGYEKGNHGYVLAYNICLIKHYDARIKYYKENRF